MSDAHSGDPLWDDWDAPPLIPSMPVLHLDGFDGPMDLLLDLAERQRIDLGRLSIVELATQFAASVAQLESWVPMARRADWLLLATRLVLLRSRLLLAGSPTKAAAVAEEAEAAVQQLEDAGAMRVAAAWLERRPQLGVDVFVRPVRPRVPQTGYVALMEACLAVLRGREGRPQDAPAYALPRLELWRVPDALAQIRAMLPGLPEGAPLTAFLPKLPEEARELQARAAVAGTFVAGLELARAAEANLAQEEGFGEVTIAPATSPTPASVLE